MTQTEKELTMLLPSFQYIHKQIKDIEDKSSRDYELAKTIHRTLARRILMYKKLQPIAIEEWNNIESKQEPKEYNVMLLGMSLLAAHMEVSRKKIVLGLDNEIIELQDLMYSFFEVDQIDDTARYAETVREELGL